MTVPISVLAVGAPESDLLAECAGAFGPQACVVQASSVATAVDCLERGAIIPTVIAVGQDWPGKFSQADIDRLWRLAPLARIWCVAGSWSEGELRSGRAMPGALRSYWHQWPARWSRETGETSDRLAECALPVTAGEEERALHRSLALRGTSVDQPSRPVIIRASSAETASSLGDACAARGHAWVWQRPDQPSRSAGAQLVIWDSAGKSFDDPAEARRIVVESAPMPVIAITSFLRPHTYTAAIKAGVAAVIAKPFLLADLYWHMDEAVRQGN